jgi:hypothetical protein
LGERKKKKKIRKKESEMAGGLFSRAGYTWLAVPGGIFTAARCN